MTTTLYVGNLPWGISEEELAQTFSTHGEVKSCRIITDRETGRSRGFGFVEVSDEEAQKVIDSMNGQTFDGRAITVNHAQARPARY